MNEPVLTDKSQPPTPAVIYSHIGTARASWDALFEHIRKAHPTFREDWRYYNDGKSWLLRILKKAKTICWVSVGKGSFRVTFYFPPRAENVLGASSISDALKKQFAVAKDVGKIRPITIRFAERGDLKSAAELLALKEKFK